MTVQISSERAARIAKAQACASCGEYSYKHVKVKPASAHQRESLAVLWQVTTTCGVCGAVQETGIDDDGDVVYVG